MSQDDRTPYGGPQGPYQGGPPQQPPPPPYQPQQPPQHYGAPQPPPGGQGQGPYGPPPGPPQHYGTPPQQPPYQPQQPQQPPSQPPGGGGGLPPGTPWLSGPGQQPYAPKPRRNRWLIVGLAALLVVVVGGGGAFAINLLSGGGTQPHDVLPSNALGYVRVDLDPSAGQKVAMLDFARKFPEVRKRIGASNDLHASLFEALRDEDNDKIDFERDVKPWFGDRVGIAVLPPAEGQKEPEAVLAVQVKDEQTARAGIQKLRQADDDLAEELKGLTFLDGYAILAKDQGRADRAAATAKQSPLAKEQTFSDDAKLLGEDGVFSFWLHLGRMATVGAATQGMAGAQKELDAIANARYVGAMRFDGRYAELASQTVGMKLPEVKSPIPVRVADLPDSTVAALSISGLGDGVAQAWPKLLESAKSAGLEAQLGAYLSMAEDQYGLSLPADLQTILGKNFTVAADGSTLDKQPLPEFGARITTDVDKAEGIVDVLEKAANDTGEVDVKLARAKTDDAFIVATSQEYADALAKGGKLGESESFQLAVPSADKATFALYADLDKLEKLYLKRVPEQQRANTEVLQAIGISGGQSSDGNGTFTIRVVVK